MHIPPSLIPFPHKTHIHSYHYPQELSFALLNPAMPLSRSASDVVDKCALPFLSPNGTIVFFDVQSAAPGTFTVPGAVELETYEPGSMVETSWIFFKGDPQTGP